ncbi:MAG: hypothetical protein RLZZ450_725 [Pseudomonadota bacterium]
MERLKTRIWRGGIDEILGSANKAGQGTSSPLAVTRILTADEASEVHRVVHSHLHHKQSSEAQVQALAQELGLRPRRKRFLGWSLVVLSICVGGWFAQRAAATSKVKTTRPAPLVEAATVPIPTVEPLVLPASQPLRTETQHTDHARARGLPRAAVDALAAGDHSGAAALYRQLAAQAGQAAPFAAAAEILSARTERRHAILH